MEVERLDMFFFSFFLPLFSYSSFPWPKCLKNRLSSVLFCPDFFKACNASTIRYPLFTVHLSAGCPLSAVHSPFLLTYTLLPIEPHDKEWREEEEEEEDIKEREIEGEKRKVKGQ